MTASTRARPAGPLSASDQPAVADPLPTTSTSTPKSQLPPRRALSSRRASSSNHALSASTSVESAPVDLSHSSDSSARAVRSTSKGRLQTRQQPLEHQQQESPLHTPLLAPSQQGDASGPPGRPAVSVNTATVDIDPKLVDALPLAHFPKRGYPLHPQDAADPLLVFCGRALASVGNRALTPKELALICMRRYGWSCAGSQPFAVISASIRSHLRRAASAHPPYQPMFSMYELTSVMPPEDVRSVGIDPK